MLYDKDSMRLTGLIDFDFAHNGTFADEFFRSLPRQWGQLAAPRGLSDAAALHKAMLEGFPDPLPANTEDINWVVAKEWDDALQKHTTKSPKSLKNMKTIANLFWFSGEIAIFLLVQDHIVKQAEKETLSRWRARSEAALAQFLEDYGF